MLALCGEEMVLILLQVEMRKFINFIQVIFMLQILQVKMKLSLY